MAAGERARTRAERERQATAAAGAQAARAARAARRRSLTRALSGLSARMPSLRPGQSGAYAARRRNEIVLVVSLLVAVDVLTFFATDEWALRLLVFVVGLLAAPVLHTVLFRKA